MDIEKVLEGLYASEINASVSWFWDAGFDWQLGDDMNGVCAKGCCKTIKEVAAALHTAAIEHFPGSVYAKTV